MIFLAPFSVGRHGVSQAPHTILGVRNGETFYHSLIAEIPVHHHDASVTATNIHKLLRGRSKYLVLGGDHSITLGILRARAEEGPVHLVMFDAHSDDYDSAEVQRVHPVHSGNWLRIAKEEHLITGVSWFNYRGLKFHHDYGTTKVAGAKRVHVTVDIDVVNPMEIGWATPFPTVGGCSLERLLDDIKALRLPDGSTADLVEYDPARDHSRVGGQACSLITTALLEAIGA